VEDVKKWIPDIKKEMEYTIQVSSMSINEIDSDVCQDFIERLQIFQITGKYQESIQ